MGWKPPNNIYSNSSPFLDHSFPSRLQSPGSEFPARWLASFLRSDFLDSPFHFTQQNLPDLLMGCKCLLMESWHILSTVAPTSRDDSFSWTITEVSMPVDTHEQCLLPQQHLQPHGHPQSAFSILWSDYPSLKPTLFNFYFIFNYMSVGGKGTWKCVLERWCPQRLEALDPARATGGCECPGVGTGNRSWDFCKSSMHKLNCWAISPFPKSNILSL